MSSKDEEGGDEGMPPAALEGVKVLELATMVSGPYCGKLFGDLGARVVKVEPPEGDPARRCGPFRSPDGGSECSALFLYNNTSKHGVCLDLGTAEGRRELDPLIAWADILIDNHGADYLPSLGLDWPALKALNRSLIYTSITPYGRSGPRAGVKGDELTLVQAGGLGNLLPSRSQDVDRAPVMLGGRQVAYQGAIAAALATLGALLGRGPSGDGCLVEISLQEVVLSLVGPLATSTRYQDTTWRRVPDRPPAMGRMRTRDGYVILNAFDDHHFEAFRELMGSPEWCAGDEWRSMAYRVHHLMEIAPRIDDWMLQQGKSEIHYEAGRRGIPIGPINDARDVMESTQYEARDFFVTVEHPTVGKQRYAGWPYRMSASPPRVSAPAPLLGAGADPKVREWLGDGAAGVAPGGARGARSRPLEGVRVVELCWVWAGPYAGSLLAALGAEVIKVEGHRRTDLTRRGVVWPLQDPAPHAVPPNQGMAYNQVNLGKKSLTVDLTQSAGVELIRRLAATSDVVIDNMRPGALAKRGLGYDDLKRVRPDIIVGSSSGRGYVGDQRDFLGYAMIHQGIGGGAYITGYPDDHPCHSGGDIDLMNAMTLAWAVLAALHHRQRTGEGQFIDYSQCEGVSSLLGEILLGYEMNGEIPERQGNRHPTRAPHNVYRAWGVDRWVAIEVIDDRDFTALATVIGQPELARDERFGTAVARKANEAELDDLIGGWTRDRDRDWVVDQLSAVGVAAAPSREARDLWADPHLRARGAFTLLEHPELGALEMVAPPWRVDDQRPHLERAPLLGEHNDEILGGILGLSVAEIEELRGQDVIQ